MKRHVAEYERAARNVAALRAKAEEAEAALAGPLVELARVVGRPQAAMLVGVDVRAVNKAYKTVAGGKG